VSIALPLLLAEGAGEPVDGGRDDRGEGDRELAARSVSVRWSVSVI
jgi:hypothetical protein